MQSADPPPPRPPGATAPAGQPSTEPGGRPVASRISDAARLVIAAVVGAAVVLTIFCAQNTRATSVQFLVWSWPGAPLFVVILASVALGTIVGGMFVWLRLVRYSLEHRVPGRRQRRP
jgi:uncharacterized integral membrane protein